jgi:hypothetical protein
VIFPERYLCISGDRKIRFIHLPQSQNNYMKICVHWKPCFVAWRNSWEVWNSAVTAQCVLLTNRMVLHFFTCLICGESYVYWALRNSSSVHSVAVTRSCDTQDLTTSSSSSSTATTYPFFILHWERVSWPFLDCNYCIPVFQLGPLAFLSFFHLSLWAFLATVFWSRKEVTIIITISSQ